MKRLSKKGLYFTIDAILALSLVFIVIIVVSAFYSSTPQKARLEYTSYDILQVLGELKIGEVDNAYIELLINNGTIKRLNNTVLEQIGEFWADGNAAQARDLTYAIMNDVYGEDENWALSVAGDLVYTTSQNVSNNVRTAKRMISGLEKLKPTYGFTARE